MSPILGIIASSFRSAAGPDGAYDALATVTVPSGGLAGIEFAGIPTGYKHLQIRALFQTTRATFNTDDLDLAFNGVTTGGKYAIHYLDANNQNNGTVNSAVNASANKMFYIVSGTTTVATNCFGSAIIDILDYADISKNKTVRALSGGDANGGASGYFPIVRFSSGLWMDTSAVNSIALNGSFGGSSIAAGSQFSLYGIK